MTDVPLIPLDVLFGNPERIQPQISPDGRRLAYIAPSDGVLNVWVRTVGADDDRPVTDDRDRGIRAYAWAHNGRHLVYVQDQGGDENWRLYSVDLDTGETRDHTPFEGVQVRFVGSEKQFPDELLIGLNKDNPQLHDVYRLNLVSGELTKVADNPGFLGWIVDADLRVRGALAPNPDGGFSVLVRDDEGAEWRALEVFESDDMMASGPVGFTQDGKAMHVLSSKGANAARLVLQDLTTGETEVLASDPRYDVVGVMRHPDTKQPQAATVLKDRMERTILDPSVAGDFAAIAEIHAGDFGIVDRDDADQMWLVGFTDDAGPIKYYAFDRGTKHATFLFDHRPELNDHTLAAMEPFSFTSRDGLEVHGYLTFPPGGGREGLPTVLNVHGGPWARDTWGFTPEAQFLANRGYLCVQVNYRGSSGYGKEFVNAGDREWGGRMHDDLLDAVQHVVGLGHADPSRIAIYGGSYGGYASLVGATFTPDVFACAIALVGPANLKTFIETIPPYWQPMVAMWHRRVGNPETDEEFLWSRSPLSRVDQIRIPMIVGHGANDPRVKQSESEQIVAAMREKGIDHEYLLFDDEGHGFAKPENRLRFYAAVEVFLAKHLGGRSED